MGDHIVAVMISIDSLFPGDNFSSS